MPERRYLNTAKNVFEATALTISVGNGCLNLQSAHLRLSLGVG